MPSDAMTFVKWDVFRAGAGERYSRGYTIRKGDPMKIRSVFVSSVMLDYADRRAAARQTLQEARHRGGAGRGLCRRARSSAAVRSCRAFRSAMRC